MGEESSTRPTTTSNVPDSAENDPMNRRLIFHSTESERRERALRLAPDAPSFSLDTPPDEDVDHEEADPSAHSITPVPHEYDKRIVKKGPFQKSPFVNPETEKSYNVSKTIEELYSMVCEHETRRNPNDPNKGKTIIDLDEIYCNLGDLADSVAPRHQMVNIVAEVGIEIIKQENDNPKKYIMPLRIAVSKLFTEIFINSYILLLITNF